MKEYPIYKGLQKPLSFKGLKGRFIGWGVASLVLGLVLGGMVSALINIYLGGLACIASTLGLLGYTLYRQKQGLYSKSKQTAVFIQPSKLMIQYEKQKEF